MCDDMHSLFEAKNMGANELEPTIENFTVLFSVVKQAEGEPKDGISDN
jgi:hypothetical protein